MRDTARELDPVIEAYKKDIDRTLIRENLKLTPDQRLRRLQDFMESVEAIRGAAYRRVFRPTTNANDRTAVA